LYLVGQAVLLNHRYFRSIEERLSSLAVQLLSEAKAASFLRFAQGVAPLASLKSRCMALIPSCRFTCSTNPRLPTRSRPLIESSRQAVSSRLLVPLPMDSLKIYRFTKTLNSLSSVNQLCGNAWADLGSQKATLLALSGGDLRRRRAPCLDRYRPDRDASARRLQRRWRDNSLPRTRHF
jgi:hypothetical protein